MPDVRQIEDWIERLIKETRSRMAVVLPFSDQEQAFIKAVNERGEVRPELLTTDTTLRERIATQPGLRWKVLNVRRHLRLDP